MGAPRCQPATVHYLGAVLSLGSAGASLASPCRRKASVSLLLSLFTPPRSRYLSRSLSLVRTRSLSHSLSLSRTLSLSLPLSISLCLTLACSLSLSPSFSLSLTLARSFSLAHSLSFSLSLPLSLALFLYFLALFLSYSCFWCVAFSFSSWVMIYSVLCISICNISTDFKHCYQSLLFCRYLLLLSFPLYVMLLKSYSDFKGNKVIFNSFIVSREGPYHFIFQSAQ